MSKKYQGLEIAIIGMSVQFPNSADHRAFWKNLADGNELLTEFTTEALLQRGMAAREVNNEFFVNREGVVDHKDRFDNAFFGYTPHEAAIMDPQIRLMHENCWRALEDAGYAAATDHLKIGLFAGAADNETWRAYTYANDNPAVDPLFKTNISRPGFMCTLVSNRLNLRGPSVFIDTACSTSLAAIHLASRSLLTKECTLALAGGVTINTHPRKGYIYQKEGIKSIDGHTRTFDADASGTGGGEGIGIVVLKRLQEAINDRDHIYAIIKSSAWNNDGSNKVGYTAPGVKGQADCIKLAHKVGGIDPQSISYMEAHGTATKLGDVVEMRALNEAFNKSGSVNSCAIGSVKTNIGHLDRAAGIAGVVKTALSLYNKQLPASLFFDAPNPAIDFKEGPFYVNTKLTPWTAKDDQPLRAGVSSFGIGGTNVHAVLEEAPDAEAGDVGREFKLLALSARTEQSLVQAISLLNAHVLQQPEGDVADMAYTLLTGRKHFEYRTAVVFKNREELLSLLASGRVKDNITKNKWKGSAAVFMFAGLGTQYAEMCRELFEQEPVFRTEMDRCFALIKKVSGFNIQQAFLASFAGSDDTARLFEIDTAQYLVFAVEYALAKLLMHWGIQPTAMIGYSFGEYVAACIAGVFPIEDAIKILYTRGQLIKNLPGGAMLSVPLTAKELQPLLNGDLFLAIDNGASCVVSGKEEAVVRFEKILMQQRLMCVRLQSSHALHAPVMEAIAEQFSAFLRTISLNAPQIPYISNVTGDWIKATEAVDPAYWVKHVCQTVQFAKGVETLTAKDKCVYIEIGPGNEISTLVNRYLESKNNQASALNTIRPGGSKGSDVKYLINKVSRLWAMGIGVDWTAYYESEKRRRVSLPTYAFEPNQYPAEINPFAVLGNSFQATNEKKEKLTSWFHEAVWKQAAWLPGKGPALKNKTVLLLGDEAGVSEQLKEKLAQQDCHTIVVKKGPAYEQQSRQLFTVNPGVEQDMEALFAALYAAGNIPEQVLHCWQVDAPGENGQYDQHALGYESLLGLVRSYHSFFAGRPLQIRVIGNGWYNLLGSEVIQPAKSTVLGALKVMAAELSNIDGSAIEISDVSATTVAALWKELNYASRDKEVAIRGSKRYIREISPIDFELPDTYTPFKQQGTYVITGAGGGMGQTFAKYLAEHFQANLVLIGRSEEPMALTRYLHNKNARTVYIRSSVADEETIRQGIERAEQEFGAINGIIHTAGVVDHAGMILRRTKQEDDAVLMAKVQGTQVLDRLFKNKPLDFFVNCSSLAATLGPVGHVAYTAANIYQDTYAEAVNAISPVISIQWANMKEVGMSVPVVSHLSQEEQDVFFKLSISPGEAIQVLRAAIYLQIPTPIIYTADLKELVRKGAPKISDVEAELENDAILTATQKRARPDLSNDYIHPVSETEIKLASLFSNYLGIEAVGTEDDFFELGGDSLKAMVLLRRISKDLNTGISLKEFLTSRNIRSIAASIEEEVWISTPSLKKYSAEI